LTGKREKRPKGQKAFGQVGGGGQYNIQRKVSSGKPRQRKRGDKERRW